MYRFFAEAKPPLHSQVMATLDHVDGDIYYLTLPEYGNIEAIMPISQLTSKRLRSKKQVIDIGQTKPMVVIDDENGMITLSIKNADPSYLKNNAYINKLHSLGLDVAYLYCKYLELKNQEYDESDIYNKILSETSWLFTRLDNPDKRYAEIVENPLLFVRKVKAEDDFLDYLKINILDRIDKKAGLLEQDIKIISYASDGNDRLILFFKELLEMFKENNFTITMISAPIYRFRLESVDLEDANKYLNEIVKFIEINKKKSLIVELEGEPILTKPISTRIRTINSHDDKKMEEYFS